MKIFGYEVTIGKITETVAEAVSERKLDQRRLKISEATREKLNAMGAAYGENGIPAHPVRTVFDIVPYTPPKGVAPAQHVMAMDRGFSDLGLVGNSFYGSGFPGFAYLTELDQLTEYRDMSERVAAEMTRKWIKFKGTGDKDRTKEIKKLNDEVKRLGLRDLMRKVAEMDGKMGRAQVFIDLGESEGPELATPLLLSKLKVRQNKLRALRIVEPINTYPQNYDSINPLSEDYYNPVMWYVQGRPVHKSRLLTFVSRPVPNMLKPAYNFSGMSLSQLAQPYVDYWFSTRDSVGKLLKNFSTSILKTNMQDVLEGGDGSNLIARAKLYTKMRDNQGLFLLDSDSEDFSQVNTPLAGLTQFQSQAQEHMAAVAKTPLIVLLGVSPTGLNASSEGEIRVFYDYVSEQQEKLFRPNMEIMMQVIQLSLFGEIYEDITFDFVSLYQLTGKELSLIRASDATAGTAFITAGVIDATEERQRLSSDPDSGYNNLDMTKKIEKPMPTMIPGQKPTMSGGAGDPGEKPTKPKEQKTEPKVGDAAGFFAGNQHTGMLEAMSDTDYAVAVKHSSVASKSTSTATLAPTKRNHMRAVEAHQRALTAQKTALAACGEGYMQHIHDEYIKSHEAMIEAHEAACELCQERIDAFPSNRATEKEEDAK